MDDIFKSITRSLKDVILLNDNTISDVDSWISTGVDVLDSIMGEGVPEGRIVEIFGDESTGKSTLGLSILRQVQLKGDNYIPVLIDTEASFDTKRAEELGLDVGRLLYVDLDTIEDIFDFMKNIAKEIKSKGNYRTVIVWDSLAATTTKAELEGMVGDQQYGLHARLLSQGFRMYRRLMSEYNVTLVVINQTREAMNTGYFGPSYVTFGGKALKFYSSIRLRMRVSEKIKKGDEVVGVKIRAETVKNKVYSPFKECYIYLDFEKGFDNFYSSVEYLLQKGVLKKSSGWVEYKNKKYRVVDLVSYFKENEVELKQLMKEVT